MNPTAPLRSFLFVPGNRPRLLDKARSLPADAVILDLEDGVPPGEKVAARATVRRALTEGAYAPFVILRLNGWATGLTEADLRETFTPAAGAVCLPKADTPSDVERLDALLGTVEAEHGLPAGSVGLFLMIETALGVLNAYPMACTSDRVRGLLLGGEDLAHDLGAVRTKGGPEIAHSRAQLVLAARAAGVAAVDTIWPDLDDLVGLLAEAHQARQIGYSGKLVVHPAQIEPVHRAFAPTEQELAYACRVVEAFDAAEARGEGVIALDGQMIDAPVVARARRVLASP